ncbi:hypothetical protein HII12_005225 [Brettanomyces bruxellensis]|uniref:mitogen-activated protein kinase kinase n=1 Tax=Dekkera bruxellensis TaxID=5007 RepID=A0A8H6B6R7_DEKBR|nr:uncharacterized protein BRETT_004838 [Brettanomyces bruxellensis]KAF6006002.1 hypothetical protein HII12_005225 [Brettanomyces bruxellensis]QOU20186.1 hypothetical protein BRETT_004838 [Brettanomyces bruxellensis]
MNEAAKNKVLPPLPNEVRKFKQHIRTSASIKDDEPKTASSLKSRRSKRPPPLILRKSVASVHSFGSPCSASSASSDTSMSESPHTPFYEHKMSTSEEGNVIINHRSSANMISARSLSRKGPDLKLESRSLNRRNLKKLTLKPVGPKSDESRTQGDDTDEQNDKTPEEEESNTLTPLAETHRHSIYNLDPERKASTDELISNIQHLELGVEYQVPIKAEELVQLKKLGSGNSGTVSKVLHIPTQKIMARKVIHLEAKEVVQSQIIRELRIMHECDSPFIIGFYGAFLHEGDVVLCMEYVDCGSFDKILKLTGPLPEFMLKHVAYSVLSGLNYLYDTHRIIHRDVKPSNVLLDSRGHIKLCDFGVSKELINSMADTFVGTSTYMSPERIQGGVYTVKGDVWSLGIMLYELASGRHAYSDANDPNHDPDSILELLQRIVNEAPPQLSPSDGYSAELCDFVAKCLKRENQRAGPRELVKHPFLSDFVDADGFRVSQKYRSLIKRWAKNVRRMEKGKPVK